ncbi:11233_t:CDS:2 [Diversispora eburnea]|uniref:11233_t:CDS:1 n=2 Tax=Diversisporales TaxID=214509 RepID=A0A9N8ZSU7_9GLOM|nr:11233_t:CDS:2 [Diversispora eburnea]
MSRQIPSMRLREREEEDESSNTKNNEPNQKYSLEFINNSDNKDEKHSLNYIMTSNNTLSTPSPPLSTSNSRSNFGPIFLYPPHDLLNILEKENFTEIRYSRILEEGWKIWNAFLLEHPNFEMNELQTNYLNYLFASLILDRLYLGSSRAGTDVEWLKNHKISHILIVADNIFPLYPENYKYKTISINDHRTENIAQYFDITSDFIHLALEQENGTILVHCQLGISRSSSIVIAYLMKYQKMSFEDAYKFVTSKRPAIRPNVGFRKQLIEYEALLTKNEEDDKMDVD